MRTVTDWLEQYLQICENLLAVLSESPDGYSDEKLASVESAIQVRQELLDELAGLDIRKTERDLYAPKLEAIKGMESEIESRIRAMMSELEAERLAIQEQRSELSRLQRANRSYAGMMKSTEGYFIDKKK